jgi:hypothetical protein
MEVEILHKSGSIVSAIPMNETITTASDSNPWMWFRFDGHGLPGKRSKQAEYGMNNGDRRHFT